MLAWVLAGVVALIALAAAIRLLLVSRRAQAERASAEAGAAAQRERIAALERAADDLRASEASYRALVEAAPDWIWTCDPEGVLTFSNPAGAGLLGREELVGRPLAELTHPEDRPALRADGWSGVVRRGHADGTWRTVETSSIPVRDGEGRLAGWRGIDRDLTPSAPLTSGLPERPGVAIVRRPGGDGRRRGGGDRAAGGGRSAGRWWRAAATWWRTSSWATAACSTATRPTSWWSWAAGAPCGWRRRPPVFRRCRPRSPCFSSRPARACSAPRRCARPASRSRPTTSRATRRCS